MNIIFYKEFNKEIFNNKVYPLGTTFTFIVNQLSSLAYNTDFKLESYKNIDLVEVFFDTIKQAKNEKQNYINSILSNCFKENEIHENDSFPIIEIENIPISAKEFKELTLFILDLDEFLENALNDENIMRIESFLYYFSTIKGYNIPSCKIISANIDNNIPAKEIYKKNDSSGLDFINNNYKNIVKEDFKTIKLLSKNNSFIYEYKCNNFIDVLVASLRFIIEQKVHLKKCELCYNFFIASHDNKKFCDNIRPQYIEESDASYLSKKYTCSEYNKKILSIKNLPEEQKSIRRIKANIRKRIKNGTEDEGYLNEWEKIIQKKRTDYENGYISFEKYIKWLDTRSDINQKGGKNNGSSRNNKK